MSISKDQVLELLWANPVEIGHWVGFGDLTDLHNKWLRGFLYSDEDQTLQAHRGSFKTTTLSLFFAIHAIIKPNETLLYFRKTGADVEEIARQTVKILNSGCMQTMVKILYGKDLQLTKATSNEIQTNLSTTIKGASQIVGLGIGTSITGKHADIICTDDIVNINDRISAAERERTKMAYMEMQNIKNRGGRFINTGTPWHKDDAFTLMPNPVKYPWQATGLITKAQADMIREHMTNSLFAANYELRHIAEDDVIFANPQTGADLKLCEQGVCHVDAAFYGEDYTAMTICAIHDGKFYVFGKCWRKHIDDVMDDILRYCVNLKASRIWCELNADKGYVAKQFKERGGRVATYTETQNKYIKIVSHLKFEWQDVIFCLGTDPEYIEQVCDYNENAAHDDCPDSLASLIRIMARKKIPTDPRDLMLL